MVSLYVFDVEKPFSDPHVTALRNDVFVWDWRYKAVYQLRFYDAGKESWPHPFWFTFVLLKYEERLSCRDFTPPRMLDLARRVGGDRFQVQPPPTMADVRHLRLLE